MPSVVIKPDRDRDEYVVWSTVTESPHGFGSRAEVVELLRDGIRRSDEDRRDPESPVARADKWGSSAMPAWGEGHWGDDVFIYHQAGILRRHFLGRAARLLAAGRERDVLELLEPFEDEDGPERLAEAKRRAGGGVSMERERAVADLALGRLKSEVESWNHRT